MSSTPAVTRHGGAWKLDFQAQDLSRLRFETQPPFGANAARPMSIGTSGCFTSPDHYGAGLRRGRG